MSLGIQTGCLIRIHKMEPTCSVKTWSILFWNETWAKSFKELAIIFKLGDRLYICFYLRLRAYLLLICMISKSSYWLTNLLYSSYNHMNASFLQELKTPLLHQRLDSSYFVKRIYSYDHEKSYFFMILACLFIVEFRYSPGIKTNLVVFITGMCRR